MLPRHIIACVLFFFFFFEFAQLQQKQLLLLLCQWRLHLVGLERSGSRKNFSGLRTEILANTPTKNRDQIFLTDIFLQIMACKLTNLSDFTPDKNLSCFEVGRRRL